MHLVLTFLRFSHTKYRVIFRAGVVGGSFMRTVGAVAVLMLLLVATASAADWQRLAESADSLAAARNFDSAVVVGSRCLRAMERSADVHDTIRADRLFEVGRYNLNLNRYDQADSLWQISLELREQHLPDSHAAILNSLRYLSFIYLVRGQYAQAEALLRRSLVGWEQSRPQDTSFAANMLTRLGVICMNQSRTGAAQEFYERALSLITTVSSPDIKVANALHHNLAYLYALQKKYAEAENMWLSLVAFLENTDDTTSENLAAAFVNLAELCDELGRFGKAEAYLQKALTQNERLHGLDSYPVAIVLTSLGNSLMEQGKLREAADTYQRSLTIKREAVGATDRSVANTLIMYSQVERELGNIEKSLSLALESFTIRRHNFVNNYWVLPEGDAIDYSTVMRGSASAFFAAFAQRSDWDDATNHEAADIILATKGQVTDCMFDRQQSVTSSDDPELRELLDRYSSTAQMISQLYLRGPGAGDPAQYRNQRDSLTRIRGDLEIQIALRSGDFMIKRDSYDIRWEKIRSLLPANSSLIEYVKLEFSSLRDSSATGHYFVLVMRPHSEPVVKHLGVAAQIDSMVAEYRRLYENLSQAWPASSETQMERSEAVHELLYRQLVVPVEEHLVGAELVMLAPDGPLNLIAFGGLRDPSGPYLIEKYPLHYLAAGRDLIRLGHRPSHGRGLLAFGGIDFGTAETDHRGETSDASATVAENENSGFVFRGGLTPLPYTKREVVRVAKLWEEFQKEPSQVVTGADAGEERFKQEAPGKRVIHCATHGFFGGGASQDSEQGSESPGSHADNPLVRSGLFFAGVNSRLMEAGDEFAEDGFLTALEVANLNLKGVEWVVLSACGSGLGEVQTGEGVYGLRRAFMMAGARTVISSLWSVPDKQTQSIMEQLYSGKETNLAFAMQRIALKEIEKLRARGLQEHPFPWSAFIAVGDWRIY
jgi:CHAT domain-containing protein/Flp pilus assembly protein TadD